MAPYTPVPGGPSKPMAVLRGERLAWMLLVTVLCTLCMLLLAWGSGVGCWRPQQAQHVLLNATQQPRAQDTQPAQQAQETQPTQQAQETQPAQQTQQQGQEQQAQQGSPHVVAEAAAPGGRFAYVFYMSSSQYMCSALANARRIIDLGKSPHFDIVFLTSPSFRGPEHMHQAAERMGIITKQVPELRLGEFSNTALGNALRGQTGYYHGCMMKLQAFNLTEYKRVLFLDADQFVLKNMEHFFTQTPSVILAAPRAYWLNPGVFPQGYKSEGWKDGDGPEVGPQMKFGSYWMLIEPTLALSKRLFGKYYPDGKPQFKDVFDMDLVNIEFKDDVLLLPGNTVVGSWDFMDKNKPPEQDRNQALRETVPEIEEWFRRAYVMHFSTPGKVWSWTAQGFNTSYPHARDELKGVWSEWWRLAGEVCNGKP